MLIHRKQESPSCALLVGLTQKVPHTNLCNFVVLSRMHLILLCVFFEICTNTELSFTDGSHANEIYYLNSALKNRTKLI